ncbi:MAG: hypothetical protein H7210_08045 [Pyrinomonadaceae bacterium]|nr:hypothetical protein [Phycisphaerales bacterium]
MLYTSTTLPLPAFTSCRLSLLGALPILAATFGSAVTAVAHVGPITIARSDTQIPQIVLEGPHGLLTGEECIELLPGDGPFAGLFVEDEPSFETLLFDDGAQGRFRLLPGAEIALRRVSFNEGFRIFEPVEFREILSGDNVFFVFPRDADGDFNIHLIGGSDRAGQVSATFQIFDMTGQHADSEPFTVCFQTVPAPSSLAVPALGLLVALRRARPRH